MTVRDAVRSALALLSRRDRRLLGISVIIQMGTSLLDLVGVLLIGAVGALSVAAVQSQPPPAAIETVASTVGLADLSTESLVMALAAAAAFVLLGKSVINAYLTRRVLMFLANRQAMVSGRLTKELLSRPLTFVQLRSSQETAFALIGGAGAATLGVLGFVVVALSEIALLFTLGIALLFVSPWAALGSIAFFVGLALVLQRILGRWASRVGAAIASTEIDSLNAVQEAIGAYREVTVADRRLMYVSRIQELRWAAARVAANSQFIGMLPKYIFEAALVVGGFVLAGALFATQNATAAVGTLALFLAAGSRVMPSLLRLQGATLGLRAMAATAGPTFALANDLGNPTDVPEEPASDGEVMARILEGYPDFSPSIEIRSLTVAYPASAQPALLDIDLEVAQGESIALVGPSGAGKSTLADIILGVLQPDTGSVLVGGLPPEVAIQRWPGGVGYVPQEVSLANGTIRSNVALGLTPQAVDDDLVWQALERAQLAEYLRTKREGLDTPVGERGVRLSGGQRQRLGIARALFTRPRLLVFDEATSALDAETEDSIARMIADFEGDITTIIVAHRLSTVRSVDRLLYLDHGRAVAVGAFDDLIQSVPAFRRQADLMGLNSS